MTPTEREITEEETANRIKQLIEKIQAEEKDLLDKARNQAIQDCIDIVSVTPGDENVIPKLEQLKTKP